jgi:tRNA 2-selenouridine synthase
VILKYLDGQGHQVLDLEGLAEHRGSVLGGWETPQPPQKLFESHVNLKIQNFDVSRPVWVEDEAMTIGKLHVPKFLYEAVLNGARYDIALPLEEVCPLFLGFGLFLFGLWPFSGLFLLPLFLNDTL